MASNIILGWRPEDNFCVRFKDRVAKDRSEDSLQKMLLEISEIAEKYGFSISNSERDNDMLNRLFQEQVFIDELFREEEVFIDEFFREKRKKRKNEDSSN